jgi:membrane protease YdiL (CAAX protease family)
MGVAHAHEPARSRAAAEILCLVGLIEIIMWVAPFTRHRAEVYLGSVALITVLLVVCHVRDAVPPRELGVRFDNLPRVLRAYAVPFGVAVAVLVAVGLSAGTLRLGGKFLGMLAGVPLWALLQHYMLLAFAHRRFRVVLGPGAPCVAASAAMFALMHLPNPTLTVACGAAGLVWAWQYERDPNLFANAATHTLGSAFLANSLPSAVLKNMVVGYNYFLR